LKAYNEIIPPSREQIDTVKANLMDALRERDSHGLCTLDVPGLLLPRLDIPRAGAINLFSSPLNDGPELFENGCEMIQPQMAKRKRDKEILSAIELNEQVRELGHEAAKFSETGDVEMAEDLACVADSLNYDLRERVLELVSKNLGPQQQANLMLVLRKAGEWLDEERRELERPLPQFSGLRITTREAARRLRDLNYFDTFLRCLARDVLRAMADYNFRKKGATAYG
jgi:hypothetical protein